MGVGGFLHSAAPPGLSLFKSVVEMSAFTQGFKKSVTLF
jgi:hypothetical protein